jgi:hypothetical protein
VPYALSLQEYTKPEFYERAPDSWQRRLREISPVTDHLAHLGFRKFNPRADWKTSPFNVSPERPMWAVYSLTPRHLVTAERAEQFRLHWSELPKERQVGRKAMVTDYQHFMWHSQGVEARPLWLLQGEWGGTPTLYSPREKRYLDASGAISEPFPPGYFTPCVFDERAVKGLLARDRLLQACNDLDALEKMDRPEALKAEDDAAERLFRETYLDTLSVLMAPAVEFMKTNITKKAVARELPPAPKGLANTLACWKDVFKETGVIPGVTPAPQRIYATS